MNNQLSAKCLEDESTGPYMSSHYKTEEDTPDVTGTATATTTTVTSDDNNSITHLKGIADIVGDTQGDEEEGEEEDEEEYGDGRDEMAQESVSLDIRWQGSTYTLVISKYATVLSIKVLLEELTSVDCQSQKLIGLAKGRLPGDSETLACLGLFDPEASPRRKTTVRMVGTRASDRLRPQMSLSDSQEAAEAESSDGPCTDYVPDKKLDVVISTTHTERLNTLIDTADVRILNAPRAGKKLAVLDLDYTLFDCKTTRLGNLADMARPGLHEFLSAIYPYYDIVIWSQTKWYIVESKITLLGMLTHPNYKITTVLDISTMFSVKTRRSSTGQVFKHQVKPLQFIWSYFPAFYNSSNTIHVDDVSRNFALNPQNGLKIHAFKTKYVECPDGSKMRVRRKNDVELYRLAKYMVAIATLPNLGGLNHALWKHY